MIHRGEIVESAIRMSGVSIARIARKLGISRNTLYNWFEDPNMSLDNVSAIGKIISNDFEDIFQRADLPRRKPKAYPEAEKSWQAFNEEHIPLGQVRVMIELDGSQEKLEYWIQVLTKINQSLKS